MWAPPVGDHMREREGSGRWRAYWAGSRELGRGGKEWGEEREGFGKEFSFFFKLLFFQTFKSSKLFQSFFIF
jgi:hypothetical protein